MTKPTAPPTAPVALTIVAAMAEAFAKLKPAFQVVATDLQEQAKAGDLADLSRFSALRHMTDCDATVDGTFVSMFCPNRYTEGSAETYASELNTSVKLASLIGASNALEAINAATPTGTEREKYQTALNAIRAGINHAKDKGCIKGHGLATTQPTAPQAAAIKAVVETAKIPAKKSPAPAAAAPVAPVKESAEVALAAMDKAVKDQAESASNNGRVQAARRCMEQAALFLNALKVAEQTSDNVKIAKRIVAALDTLSVDVTKLIQ